MTVARILLERGAVLRLNYSYHLGYLSPLRTAAELGHVDVVELLLSWNADAIHVPQDEVGISIACASESGHIAVVRRLVEYGADADAFTYALYKVVEGNYVAEYLLDHGADYNASSTYHASPWVHACHEGSPAMVRLLLDRGADPNLAHTTTGETLLMRAALKCRIDVTRLLLEYGAGVTQVDLEGKSVLDMLGHEKYTEVRELCSLYINSNKPGAAPVLK